MTAGWRIGVHAHRIAAPVHPQDDFVAAGAQLRQLHASALDEHHAADRLALHEEEFVARISAHVRARGDLPAFPWSQAGEERRGTHHNDSLCDVGFNVGWLPRLGDHVLPANVLSPCTSPMTTRAKCNMSCARLDLTLWRATQNLRVKQAKASRSPRNTSNAKLRVPPPVLKRPHRPGWNSAGKHPMPCVELQRNLNWP